MPYFDRLGEAVFAPTEHVSGAWNLTLGSALPLPLPSAGDDDTDNQDEIPK